jgi:septal ring factor EnvC (AmiA/AmiB activator)
MAAAPVPASKKIALEQMNSELKARKDEAKDLQQRAKSLEEELEDNRKDLVESGRAVQQQERALLQLEAEIVEHEKEYGSLQDRLAEDRSKIARLILAMDRMKEVPMEALMIRPGGMLETAQSAMIIEDVAETLARRTQRLKSDVARMDVLAQTLKEQRSELTLNLAAFEKERERLQQYIGLKEKLYASSQADLEKQRREVKRISLQASSMKDLLSGLEVQRERERQEAAQRSLAQQAVARITPMFEGDAQLPVSGIVRVGYGQPDHLDAPSDGLWIEGRKEALVVAPMDGTVRYTGTFKGYGNMVIVEHSGGYHSLIAGMDSIDTKVGYNVVKGEPIGALGKNVQQGQAHLYYELRHHGKVVNPSKKFDGLG